MKQICFWALVEKRKPLKKYDAKTLLDFHLASFTELVFVEKRNLILNASVFRGASKDASGNKKYDRLVFLDHNKKPLISLKLKEIPDIPNYALKFDTLSMDLKFKIKL